MTTPSPATMFANDPDVVAQFEFNTDDRAALVDAVQAVITHDTEKFSTAMQVLSRRPTHPETGDALVPEWMLSTWWIATGLTRALDYYEAGQWASPQRRAAISALVAARGLPAGCTTSDTAVLMWSLANTGDVPMPDVMIDPTAEGLTAAGAAVLAWIVDEYGMDLHEALQS